jgi:hypothetical protein
MAPPLYPANERVLKKAREPLPRPVAVFRVLQIFVFYNFVRIHKTLKVTPAMAAGVTERLWSMEDIVGLVDDLEMARLTGKRAAQHASA